MHTLRLHTEYLPVLASAGQPKIDNRDLCGRLMANDTATRCNILPMTTCDPEAKLLLNYQGGLIFTFRNGGWSVSPPTSRSVLASGFPVLSGQPAVDLKNAPVKRSRNQRQLKQGK